MRRSEVSENKHVEVTSSQFLVFTSEANGTIEVRYEDGTIWLTQKLMAQLFGVDVRTISEHLRNIFRSHELNEDSVIRKFRITEFSSNSPSLKMLEICSLIVRLSLLKRTDISACESHIVSSSKRTSILISPS